jgi:hypothetical protein
MKVVRVCGLEPSIGKNYYSSKFLIINSELRWFSDGHWRFEPFVNLGLLMGRVAKGTDAGQDLSGTSGAQDLGSRCSDLVRGFDGRLRDDLIRVFCQYHKKSLARFDGTRGDSLPWYLPQSLGGMGLPKPSIVELSELDRKRAAVVACLSPIEHMRMTRLPARDQNSDQRLVWRYASNYVEQQLDIYTDEVAVDDNDIVLTRFGQNRVNVVFTGSSCMNLKLGLLLEALHVGGIFGAGRESLDRNLLEEILAMRKSPLALGVGSSMPCPHRLDPAIVGGAYLRRRCRRLTALALNTSLCPMTDEKIFSFTRRYRLEREIDVQPVPGTLVRLRT